MIILLCLVLAVYAQNTNQNDTEPLTPEELNLPDFLNDPDNELFNPNYNPLIKLRVLRVNRTDSAEYEMNMNEVLKLYSVANKTQNESVSLNIRIVKKDNSTDQICHAVQQQLNFQLQNEINLTQSTQTVIPPPSPKNDYDVLLKQLVVGQANAYENYILDFTRVDLSTYYAVTFERKLYLISSGKEGLKIEKDYDLGKTYQFGQNTDVFLVYFAPVLYIFDGPICYYLKEGKFTQILAWESSNVNKVVAGKQHLIVSEKTRVSVYQVTSDFDLKMLDYLSYMDFNVKDLRLRGENKTELIVLDANRGFLFYELDFTNPYTFFKQQFNIPFVDGESFDESYGRILIAVIRKKLYSYAIEFQYDASKRQVNLTNLYWNDGIVNKVYILEEFAILTGDNSHKVIVHYLYNHLQQDKSMIKEDFDLQARQDLNGAFLYYQQYPYPYTTYSLRLQDLQFLKKEMVVEKIMKKDGPATVDLSQHEHLKEQLEVPVVIAIGRNKVSQFVIDKDPPFIYCYADQQDQRDSEFKFLVYQNFTDCPEKQEYETLKHDSKVICQYETRLTVQTYEAELTDNQAMYIIIIVVVVCVVVVAIVVVICCVMKNYKKKEAELDSKIEKYQQQKDVKDHEPEKEHFGIE